MNAAHPTDEDLQAIAEGTVEPSSSTDLARHIRGCDRCSSVVAQYESLVRALDEQPLVAPPRDLKESVLAAVRAEAEWNGIALRALPLWAACVLALVTAAWLAVQYPGHETARRLSAVASEQGGEIRAFWQACAGWNWLDALGSFVDSVSLVVDTFGRAVGSVAHGVLWWICAAGVLALCANVFVYAEGRLRPAVTAN